MNYILNHSKMQYWNEELIKGKEIDSRFSSLFLRRIYFKSLIWSTHHKEPYLSQWGYRLDFFGSLLLMVFMVWLKSVIIYFTERLMLDPRMFLHKMEKWISISVVISFILVAFVKKGCFPLNFSSSYISIVL